MRKITNQYYLSVEGETEKWYFEHLQNLINKQNDLPYQVKFNICINQSIRSRAKSIAGIYRVQAFHICDYESNEKMHTVQFEKVLEELKEVKKINPKIDYQLGYSNFSFDLWMILHKKQQQTKLSHRRLYVNGINSAYHEKFEAIDEYKEEKNFKKILSKIDLKDVIVAVQNGREIRKNNEENAIKAYRQYGKFEYYIENPDMTIQNCVAQILQECGAMQ